MSGDPSHLYHYTSIENLALILDSKRIRFTRLDQVNDPEEGGSEDLPGIEMQVFVSCWTSSEQESIPQWKLYTPDMRGCRLRLPINPFDGHSGRGEDGKPLIVLRDPVEYRLTSTDFPFSTHVIHGPSKIEYTGDMRRLKPQMVKERNGGKAYDARSLGLAKRPHWEFESEWRYRIHLQPTRHSYAAVDQTQPDETPEARDYREFCREFPFNELFTLMAPCDRWLDAPVRNDALDDCQITLGPKAKRAEWLIVEGLIERFALNATIKQSGIAIR